MSKSANLANLAKARGGTVGRSLFELLAEPAEPSPPRSKYRNVRCEWHGFTFASKAEMRYAMILADWRVCGVIRDWQPQPRFHLGLAENVYVADFLVWRPDRTVFAVDVKGKRTAKFERDLKLWRRFGPCDLWLIAGEEREIIAGAP